MREVSVRQEEEVKQLRRANKDAHAQLASTKVRMETEIVHLKQKQNDDKIAYEAVVQRLREELSAYAARDQ